MILFYDKNTGEIKGTINGRIHNERQLQMWVGENTQRIVCNWIYKDGGFEPELEPQNLWSLLESSPVKIADFVIDINTKRLEYK